MKMKHLKKGKNFSWQFDPDKAPRTTKKKEILDNAFI